MQPTTNQTVPATSSLPSQAADRQPSVAHPTPVPLDAEMLRQIGGGVTTTTTTGPTGGW